MRKTRTLITTKRMFSIMKTKRSVGFIEMTAIRFLQLSIDKSVDIKDFVSMSDKSLEQYNLLISKNKISTMPFLEITPNGKVIGHDGRHRAAALYKESPSDILKVAIFIKINKESIPTLLDQDGGSFSKPDFPLEWTSQYTNISYDMSKEVETFETFLDVKHKVFDEGMLNKKEETDNKSETKTEEKSAVSDIDFKPTSGMVSEAKKGLAWRSEYKRGGTAVGIARARDIVNGKSLSASTVKRMFSFFSRHEVDKKGKGFTPGDDKFPSNGRIAWALWGGDAGFSWSRKKVAQIKNQEKASLETGSFTGSLYHGGTYTGGAINEPGVIYFSKDPDFAGSYVGKEDESKLYEFKVAFKKFASPEVVFKVAQDLGIDNEEYTPASIFDSNLNPKVLELVKKLQEENYTYSILEDVAYGEELEEPAIVYFGENPEEDIEFISEVDPEKTNKEEAVSIDNKDGIGATTYNTDVDYFGAKVYMKPSTFLELSLPLDDSTRNSKVAEMLKSGKPMAAPFLFVKKDENSDYYYVDSHEGRNRMEYIKNNESDDPVETHIFVPGLRGRHMSAILPSINKGLFVESAKKNIKERIVRGPIFQTEKPETASTAKENKIVRVLLSVGWKLSSYVEDDGVVDFIAYKEEMSSVFPERELEDLTLAVRMYAKKNNYEVTSVESENEYDDSGVTVSFTLEEQKVLSSYQVEISKEKKVDLLKMTRELKSDKNKKFTGLAFPFYTYPPIATNPVVVDNSGSDGGDSSGDSGGGFDGGGGGEGGSTEVSVSDDPCWKSYQMVGMKKKNGKTVPNCVPKNTKKKEKAALTEATNMYAQALIKVIERLQATPPSSNFTPVVKEDVRNKTAVISFHQSNKKLAVEIPIVRNVDIKSSQQISLIIINFIRTIKPNVNYNPSQILSYLSQEVNKMKLTG